MAIIKDIIEGSLRHTSNGWEDTRVFLVTGLVGDALRRKWDAANHPEVPRRGAAHPRAPGATVQNVSAAPYMDDNAIYQVTVDYGGDSQGTAAGLEGSGIKGVEISTSTATIETREDIDGNKLIVTYEGEPFIARTAGGAFSVESFVNIPFIRQSSLFKAEYEISVLRAVVTVERPIPSLSAHQAVKMHTNRYPWSGEPSDSWLILGVDSSANGNGSHDHRYQLAHTDETWLFRGDVGNGNETYLPKDARVGNGIELFHLYPQLDYATLGFTIPR